MENVFLICNNSTNVDLKRIDWYGILERLYV